MHRQVSPDLERGQANIGVYEGFHPWTHCSWSWKRWCKHRRLWGLSSTDRLFWILREVEQTFMMAFIHRQVVLDLDKRWNKQMFMMAFFHRQVVPNLDKRWSKQRRLWWLLSSFRILIRGGRQRHMMAFIHRQVVPHLDKRWSRRLRGLLSTDRLFQSW